MSDEKHEITVKIMDRGFNVKCPTDKITELHKAAKYLDTKIKEIKNNYTKIINKDNKKPPALIIKHRIAPI